MDDDALDEVKRLDAEPSVGPMTPEEFGERLADFMLANGHARTSDQIDPDNI